MRKSSFGLASLVAMAAAAAGSITGATGRRRAQGGPGITLNTRTFEYEPRA